MKGLFMANLGKKPEGYDFIKQGIRLNIKSHVCWHVLGLLHKSEKNFSEAFKCYKTALKYDKNNAQILRDLANLQLQLRHFTELCDTRYDLLIQKPSMFHNWVSLALAYHLDGKLVQSIEILDIILTEFRPDLLSKHNFGDFNELVFYKSLLYEQLNDYEKALSTLTNVGDLRDYDSMRYDECQARLLFLCKRHKEAEAIFRDLFRRNPNSYEYFYGFKRCAATEELVLAKDLYQQHPSSFLIQSRLLKSSFAADLLTLLIEIILPQIKKGSLAIVKVMKCLYKKQENVSQLKNFATVVEQEIPSCETNRSKIWLYIFLANHYYLLGDFDSAISRMDSSLRLDPNSPDTLYQYARLLKNCDKNLAAQCMLHAQKCDKTDRFLNTKAVKYLLRAGKVEEANQHAVKFTRNGDFQSKIADLKEMQVIWYALENAKSHQLLGDHLNALKYFGQIYQEGNLVDQMKGLWTNPQNSLSLDTCVRKLEENCSQDLESLVALFRVFMFQKKPLKAAKCLYQLSLINAPAAILNGLFADLSSLPTNPQSPECRALSVLNEQLERSIRLGEPSLISTNLRYDDSKLSYLRTVIGQN